MSRATGLRDLVIDTMSTRLVGVPATVESHEWLDRTTDAVAHEHLGRALAASALPSGHWFLPRLDLELVCPGLGELPPLADGWSRALVESISASLASDPEWLHFATDTDVVAAMVVSAVNRDGAHDWAWIQAGLPEGIVRSGSPTDIVVTALRLHPEAASAALVHAAETCGVAALDHVLGASGWAAVGEALGAPEPSAPEAPKATSHRAGASSDDERRLTAVLESSPFGRLVLLSRMRPSRRTAMLWAWLIVAEVRPTLLGAASNDVSTVCDLIETRLVPRARETGAADADADADLAGRQDRSEDRAISSRRDRRRDLAPNGRVREEQEAIDAASGVHLGHGADDLVGTGHGSAPIEGALAAKVASDIAQGAPDPDAGADNDLVVGIPTEWAGLIYLLATARAACLPDCVQDDPVLAGRGVRWCVWRAGIALTKARANDPAVLALCGLAVEDLEVVLDLTPATCTEIQAVARLASRWRRITLDRLVSAPHGSEGVPTSAAAAWTWLAHRPGLVLATPGWIEIALPADAADTAVRSSGLDLDPGFISWLGTVVEFHYE